MTYLFTILKLCHKKNWFRSKFKSSLIHTLHAVSIFVSLKRRGFGIEEFSLIKRKNIKLNLKITQKNVSIPAG